MDYVGRSQSSQSGGVEHAAMSPTHGAVMEGADPAFLAISTRRQGIRVSAKLRPFSAGSSRA